MTLGVIHNLMDPFLIIPILGGDAVIKNSYEVLVAEENAKFEWKNSSNGKIPQGAIKGGYTMNGELLYIGRVLHEGVLLCGKIQPSHEAIYVSYRNKEHKYSSYEILIARN